MTREQGRLEIFKLIFSSASKFSMLNDDELLDKCKKWEGYVFGPTEGKRSVGRPKKIVDD